MLAYDENMFDGTGCSVVSVLSTDVIVMRSLSALC